MDYRPVMGARGLWVLAVLALAGCGDAASSGEAEPAPRSDAGAGDADTLPPPAPAPGVDAGVDATSSADASPEPSGDTPPPIEPQAASDPAAAGPFQVGVCTHELIDPARNRSLAVEFWYPVLPETVNGKSNAYELDGPFGSLGKFPSPALRGASPAPGAHPVVLFSHGFGGVRFQSYFLTERLASHGFIVVAPDHPGNRLQDALLLGNDAAAAQSAIDRPLDVIYALDQLLYGNACANLSVQGSGIGVTGHSFGGWTALEVARRDARFAAIFPMAPGFKQGATADFVATLARPLMIFGGSEDHTTPFATDQKAPYDLAAPPKFLVQAQGAGHLDFSNLCQVPLAKLFIDDGCDPTKVDPAQVQAKVSALSVAFARRYLRNEPSYAAYLEQTWVLGLGGLVYWRAP